MLREQQKKQELIEARKEDKQKKSQEKARKTLKKYNTGKNKGQVKNITEDVKALAKSVSPVGFIGLLMKINLASDWMYGLALIAAMFKDLLDLFEVTGVWYAIVILMTFLTSIFIALMMILGNSFNGGGGRKSQKMIKSWLVLLAGTGMEMVFGLDVLPIETLSVLIIYTLLLAHRNNN